MNARMGIAVLACLLLAGGLWLAGVLRSDRSAEPLAAAGQSAEAPEQPDLKLDTATLDVTQCVDRIVELLRQRDVFAV